jgi:hypothetical protein
MKGQTILRRMGAVVAVLFLLAVTAVPVLAWWSGWYDAGFNGSYSPGTGNRYKHGQWDTDSLEAFGSRMKWDQTRADGVRNYSNNRHWIWFCGYCYAYYTHDHTDMSTKLDGAGVGSNFPNPQYDWDDDDQNGWEEETEVVSVDQDFPVTDAEYLFKSYYLRRASGNGELYETPAVSAWSPAHGEYDTYHSDSHETLGYYTYGSRQENAGIPATGSPYTATVSVGRFPVHIWGIEGAPTMSVGLGYPLGDGNDLAAYASWARTDPASVLRKADVAEALTVVTFYGPVSPSLVDKLLGRAGGTSVEIVKAVYVDVNNPDPATNIWTLQTKVEDEYAKQLDELAAAIADEERNDDEEEPDLDLEMQGIVAITAWLSLDRVDFLNRHGMVYIADTSPSYLRLVASGTEHAQDMQREGVELLRDGFATFIRPSFNDSYPELQLFGDRPKQPR